MLILTALLYAPYNIQYVEAFPWRLKKGVLPLATLDNISIDG